MNSSPTDERVSVRFHGALIQAAREGLGMPEAPVSDVIRGALAAAGKLNVAEYSTVPRGAASHRGREVSAT